jgi:ABC-type polysaccharide transport system, permease component
MQNIGIKLRSIYKERALLYLLVPTMALFIVFNYLPIYGLIISFKDLQPGLTVLNCPWVGFKWFNEFLSSSYFWRSLKNTFVLSGLSLVVQFPAPIIFALILNEVRNKHFKKIVQSVSYFPYFLSTVIIVGMLFNFLSVDTGIVNTILKEHGKETINFLNSVHWFRPLYVISGLWQNLGWNAIIYLAALTGIDPVLYEASFIDGAKRIKQMWHITIPGIFPTIIVLLLISLGNLLNVGFEKIILMYNPSTYDVADVISTYVYRLGIQNQQYSFATAVGLFNQVVNFSLLVLFNSLSNRLGGEGLW